MSILHLVFLLKSETRLKTEVAFEIIAQKLIPYFLFLRNNLEYFLVSLMETDVIWRKSHICFVVMTRGRRMIGISGFLIWSKTLMELIFNPFGEFRWSPEGPVSQIHSPHLHVGAPGILSGLLRSLQALKTEWGVESNGKLPHLFIPSKIATLVPEFAVEDLPLDRTATFVPAFAVEDLPLDRRFWMMMIMTMLLLMMMMMMMTMSNHWWLWATQRDRVNDKIKQMNVWEEDISSWKPAQELSLKFD